LNHGGASGLGEAMSILLAGEGARVIDGGYLAK